MNRRTRTQKSRIPDEDVLIDYPDKHVLKLYRQVRGWKLRTSLSRKQMSLVNSLLEICYPNIEDEFQTIQKARWVGIVQGIGLLLILGILLIFLFT